ncbi:MAG: OmpA family protein [Limnohabitans sp.]
MKHLEFQTRPTLLALAILASPLVHAQVFMPNSGVYMGLSVGESKSHIDSARITHDVLGPGLTINSLTEDLRDRGYKAFVGFPINPYWAVETGYFDLGRFGLTANTTPAGRLSGAARIQGLNLDLVGSLPITDRWSLLGRAGAAYARTADTFSGTGAVSVTDPSPSKRETHYKYGLGTQYALTAALSLRLDAERYRVNDAVGKRGDVDLISLGLLYRFGGSTPTATNTAHTPYVAPAATPAPLVVAAAPAAPPAPAPKPWVKVKLEADSLFGFDQDTLQADGKLALDKLIMALQAVNLDAIQVTGHTDHLGSKAYNDKLSLRRAQAVQSYLVQMGGIPVHKITAIGVGSSQPETQPKECKGSKATEALITCLHVDRRVKVDVTGSQQQR